jgi:cell division protein FtsB
MGFALFGDRGVLHLMQLHQQRDLLAQDLLQIEQQNSALRKEITALRSDRRYIERVARTELGMVREDELVFQFAPQSQP